MSNHLEPNSPSQFAWQTESLRLTAFPLGPITRDQPKIWPSWQSVFGSSPENDASKNQGQEIKQDGTYAGHWLTYNRQPSRLDWVLHDKPDESRQLMTTIGSFDEVVQPFAKTMLAWLEKAPLLNRLAFGAVLSLPADREKGYRILSSLLPVKLDATTSRDFLYQINRPRPSAVLQAEGLQINRLSKWMVAKVKAVQLLIMGDATSFLQNDLDYTCRLEIDINTPAEWKNALPKTELGKLSLELIDMAKEIAQKGDV